MDNPKCGSCGAAMKRNGFTSSGGQRWRCKGCGASFTHRIDSSAKQLDAFLRWLFSKATQKDMAGCGRTFRRKCARFWKLWPVSPCTGEVHDVVFLDGIWIGRDAVVLIACTGRHVLAWHLAHSENSASWATLMSEMAPPVMAVADGAGGFAKAARAVWPTTRIQRCLFHAFCQVKRETTTRPKLDCGKELYDLAKRLLKVKDVDSAVAWMVDYASWCTRWDGFLKEYTIQDGKRLYTHKRLRKARRGLNKLVSENVLFTFVSLAEERGGQWDATSNMIEGGVNAQLRSMLHEHRGLSKMRRIKAIFWWCYMHAECPLPASEILRTMPTDDEMEGYFRIASAKRRRDDGAPEEYGTGVDWNEFHTPTEYRQ